MRTYCRLYSTIVNSSLWAEPHATRIVWITLLATKDHAGNVYSTLGGLAHIARVTKEECKQAIATLSAPDPESTTTAADGRRIKAIDGGWFVVNHEKYRDGLEDMREYQRRKQKEYRERKQKLHLGPPVSMAEKFESADDCSKLTPMAELA